jgi:hypothetical protein
MRKGAASAALKGRNILAQGAEAVKKSASSTPRHKDTKKTTN